MDGSPYRRGAGKVLLGAAGLLVAGLLLAWASRAEDAALRRSLAARDASERAHAPPVPSPVVEVPVETDPPGASVYRVDDGRHDRICAPTPCRFFVPRDLADTLIVSLELRGHASAQAHVKDVVDVPGGGTLMLTFGPPEPGWGYPADARPTLRQGAVAVTGGLPREVVARIVRQNFGRFRLCYERALSRSPDLEGTIATRLAIGRDGAVTSTEDAGSDLGDAGAVSCVVRSFAALSFPAPEGGGASVVFPIRFAPGA